MSKLGLIAKTGFEIGKRTASKYAPELSIGVGLGLIGVSIYLAITDTPKATKLLDEKKDAMGVDKLTVKDTVATTWKTYIPTVTTALLGGAFIIGSNVIAGRRAATMAAAYSLADAALKDYKEAVKATIGEEKEKEVREAVAQKHIEQLDIPQKYVTNALATGGQIYKDPFGVIFVASDADVVRGIAKVNEAIMNSPRGFAPYSIFRTEVGLDEYGSYSSYVYEKLGFRNTLQLDSNIYTIGAKTNDGRSCLELNFDLKSEYESDYRW